MARRHRRGRPVHGILLLDKPCGGSSNHALQRAKRLYGASKAGHTGSLDPLATGMLPICFGEATKLSAFLLDADKGYETTMKLGITTNSADSDGQVLETRPVPSDLNLETFTEICHRFIGHLQQIPPMVSAIKIDGQRLYKLAREGREVDRPPRPVTIHELEVLSFSGDTARLAVRCSKGTYIRSLVTDIGEVIGCGAHVTQLRRRFVSPFEQYPMITLDTLEQLVSGLSDSASEAQTSEAQTIESQTGEAQTSEKRTGAKPTGAKQTSEALATEPDPATFWPALDALLLPPDAGLMHLPSVHLDEQGMVSFTHGNAAQCVSSDPVTDSPGALCRVYDAQKRLAGLGELSGAGTVSPRRVLQWG